MFQRIAGWIVFLGIAIFPTTPTGHLVFPQAAAETIEGIAAIVNDEVITIYDVRQRARLILLSARVEPTQEAQQEAARRALRTLIDERLKLQEVRTFGERAEVDLVATDEDIMADLTQIAGSQGITVAELESQLRSAGIDPVTLRDQLRADISWRRLVTGRFSSRIRISDVQLNDAESRQLANLSKKQYRIAEILLFAPDEATRTEALGFAEQLIVELEKGAPFQLAAQQFSASPSAAAGGDLGWVAEDELRPEFKSAVAGMTSPSVSRPIVTEDGVYVLALIGVQEGRSTQERQARLKLLIAPGMSPEDGAAALDQATGLTNGCDSVETAAEAVSGVSAISLGMVPMSQLAPDVRSVIESTNVGSYSPNYQQPGGLTKAFVCEMTTVAAAGVPSRDDIRDELFSEQITMFADRYLRDLRRDATIITR